MGSHQPSDESLNLQGRVSDELGKKRPGAKGHPGSGCGGELAPRRAQQPLFAEAHKNQITQERLRIWSILEANRL